jgi:hypothetical protein
MSLKQAEGSFIIIHGSPPLRDPLYFRNLRKKDLAIGSDQDKLLKRQNSLYYQVRFLGLGLSFLSQKIAV